LPYVITSHRLTHTTERGQNNELSKRIEAGRIREASVKYKAILKDENLSVISNSRDIYQAFRSIMMTETREVFRTLLMNSKNRVILLRGRINRTISQSVVHPREVFCLPVTMRAASILFNAQSPVRGSGPFYGDRACTQRLLKAADILGIRVLDHIIFGENDYYSFA